MMFDDEPKEDKDFKEYMKKRKAQLYEEYVWDYSFKSRLQNIGSDGSHATFSTKQLKKIQIEWAKQGIIR